MRLSFLLAAAALLDSSLVARADTFIITGSNSPAGNTVTGFLPDNSGVVASQLILSGPQVAPFPSDTLDLIGYGMSGRFGLDLFTKARTSFPQTAD